MLDVALVIIGYLVGSISSAIVICRLLRLGDPRQDGSGNPGATNVLRLAGKGPAAATLAGDWLKGTLPVVLAWALTGDPVIAAATGLAAFFGHLYPLYFRFQGGKGVATGLGVLLAWSPVALGAAALTWLAVAAAFRYSSLAAIVAFAMAPIYVMWQTEAPVLWAATAILAVASIWRHRENIVRLATGEEGRIGGRSSE
ncbi:acyl-phosphate glycerol 3-phosphate acyltransferase [Halorhodospira abdelmalekii]|uniref:glycerol-3-phosphate 1-O-acyltransferase PlsY n=1 Tax=Halorhodospira abdelmalekii TaxID=421629 RepID=UPI0019079FCF|nr:glycerol-3-phosphate 1-O-acyltransferase PlsY [Halorhodospira abdelmalekii]MBK1734389.1 acyl-phosphate glycerol 3-phosphate acyltransferase [Halorhodospira abdelmalekii]